MIGIDLAAAEELLRSARTDRLDPTLRSVPNVDENADEKADETLRAMARLAKHATRRLDEDERWATIAARAWLECAHRDDEAPKAIAKLAERFPSYELRKLAADALALRACRSPHAHLAARTAYAALCVENPEDLSAWLMLLRSSRLVRHRTQPALLEDALARLPALDTLPSSARPLLSAERTLALFGLRRTNAAALLSAYQALDDASPRRVELARAYALDAVTSTVAEHDTVAGLLRVHPELSDTVAEHAKAHQKWRFLFEVFADGPLRGVAGEAVAEAYLTLHQEQELIERTADATEDAGVGVLYGRACALATLAPMTNTADPEALWRGACEALDKALTVKPTHVLSHVLRVTVLHGTGQLDAAVEHAERALALLPSRHPTLLHVLAQTKRELGDHEAAQRLLHEVAQCRWPVAKRAREELRAWYGTA